MPILKGLAYTLGYAHQAKGQGDAEDEKGFVAGVYGSFELGRGASFEPVVEYAHFENFGGAQEDAHNLTVGGAIVRGPWTLAASYTGRTIEPDAGPDTDDALYQLSVGHTFRNGAGLEVGYKYAEEGGIDTSVIGVLVTFTLGGS